MNVHEKRNPAACSISQCMIEPPVSGVSINKTTCPVGLNNRNVLPTAWRPRV